MQSPPSLPPHVVHPYPQTVVVRVTDQRRAAASETASLDAPLTCVPKSVDGEFFWQLSNDFGRSQDLSSLVIRLMYNTCLLKNCDIICST